MDVDYTLPRVTPRNLSQEVFGILRAAILSQEIPAGTRLVEADVATRLGVSRAPLREAIRQLEFEGLIQSFPRRGAYVVGLPEDEIEAFYELRAEIEARAFARACERISADDIGVLEETLHGLAKALEAGDVDAIAAGDVRFHGKVLELSGFTLLQRVWSSLEGPLRLRAFQFAEASPPNGVIPENERYPHRVLLDALKARDPERASIVARGHVLDVREYIRALADADGGA